MRGMLLEAPGKPLREAELPVPEPGPGQVLLRVLACGVCRTDLHIADGELREPKLPLVLGHQIVGEDAESGERLGVPWLGWTDGTCRYCRGGRENLCDNGRFTGYQIDGGFAQYAVANEDYCFTLPSGYAPAHAAPLLCGGLIGYRSYRMATGAIPEIAGEAARIGLYGFGSSAHMIAQLARFEGRRVFAFTRPGDERTQRFARDLGAEWAGGSDSKPPEELDAAIVFASAGELVPSALRALAKGGIVVCAGIHMSDIPSFPYEILWNERQIRSVANLTRADGVILLALAERAQIETEITTYPLESANAALDGLRHGRFRGAAVLVT